MELWIPVTLFAAVAQLARTGWQKSLVPEIGAHAVTYIRFAFALPVVPFYLLALSLSGATLPDTNATFFAYAAAAAITQITATVMMVNLFSRANFAVCTTFAHTEAVQIAILGALLFALPMSFGGIIGVVLGGIGALLMLPPLKTFNKHDTVTAGLGIGCGCFFAVTALFAKQAAHSLEADALPAAGLVLSLMLFVQTIALTVLLGKKISFPELWRLRKRTLAVGVSSFLGSAAWLTAFTLTHPAYVKTLAQISLPLSYFLGRAAFAENPRGAEIAGMSACGIAAIITAFFG